MADVQAFKKNKAGNPDPPTSSVLSSSLEQTPRSEENREPTAALQLKIPQSVYERFSEQAGREFGFKKGGKVTLFLKIWEEYQSRLAT